MRESSATSGLYEKKLLFKAQEKTQNQLHTKSF